MKGINQLNLLAFLQNTEIGNMYENIIIFYFKKVLIPIFGITLGFFFSSRSQKNREVSLGTFYFLMKWGQASERNTQSMHLVRSVASLEWR